LYKCVELLAMSVLVTWLDDAAEFDLAALQGLWTVEQYLRLTNQTNRLIEFVME
jgi:hypothetical protein